MTILKRYKILFTISITIIIALYFYNIWVVNRTINYMMTEILKSAEYQYIWELQK